MRTGNNSGATAEKLVGLVNVTEWTKTISLGWFVVLNFLHHFSFTCENVFFFFFMVLFFYFFFSSSVFYSVCCTKKSFECCKGQTYLLEIPGHVTVSKTQHVHTCGANLQWTECSDPSELLRSFLTDRQRSVCFLSL